MATAISAGALRNVGKDDAVLKRVRVVAATQKKPMTEKRSAAFEKALPPIAEKLETTLASSLNVALPAGAADDLLRKYAGEDGSLDREAFAEVVKAAREAAGPVQRDDDVVFQLVLEDGDRIPASPFLALALALRHRRARAATSSTAARGRRRGPDLPVQRLDSAGGGRRAFVRSFRDDVRRGDATRRCRRPK